MKKGKKSMKLKYFIETFIFLVHRQKQQKVFSKILQLCLLIVHHVQIVSYVMQSPKNYHRKVYDQNLQYVTELFNLFTFRAQVEYFQSNFVLYLYLVIIIMIKVFFFIYLYVKSVLKQKYQWDLENDKYQIIVILDRLFYIFINIYPWVLSIPSQELYVGIIFCNEKSLIKNKTNCAFNYVNCLIYIISLFGVSISFIFTIVISYYQVNYDFLDQNLLTRKFNSNLVFQNFLKMMLILEYYTDVGKVSNYIIKYLISITFGAFLLQDFVKFLPFRDKKICHFYGIFCCNVLYMSIIYALWESQGVLNEYNIFYLILLPQPVIVFGSFIIIKNYYDMMFIYSVNEMISKHWEVIDVFMEEIFTLAENSEKDHKAKIKLIAFIKNHLQNCKDKDCQFKKGTIYDNYLENNDINIKIIVKILQVMFVTFFNNNKLGKTSHNKDLLILKYCSFLIQQQENLVRAYFEMKRIGKIQRRQNIERNNQKLQVTFKILFQLYCQFQENQLEKAYENQRQEQIHDKKIVAYSFTITKFDMIRKKILKEIIDIVQLKQKYWEKLTDGYDKIDDFKKICINLASKIHIFHQEFNMFENAFEKQLNTKENVIILKLKSIIGSLILNDYQYTHINEVILNDMKKKEKSNLKDQINAMSIVTGKSVILTSSIISNQGIIMNKLGSKHAQFFKYNEDEIQNIQRIETFMPKVIAKGHRYQVQNFIRKVNYSNMKINRKLLAKDKNNFIFPINIYLDFCYDYKDDFCINAILTKQRFIQKFLIFNERGILNGIEQGFFNELISQNVQNQQNNGYKNYEQMHSAAIKQIGNNKQDMNLVEKIYSFMNILFFFPQLDRLLKFNKINVRSSKYQYKQEVIQNEILKLYFPVNLMDFQEQYNKYFQNQYMIIQNIQMNHKSDQKKSQELSLNDSMSQNDSDISYDYSFNNLQKNQFQRQFDSGILDVCEDEHRQIINQFFKEYRKSNRNSINKYVCTMSMWVENQTKFGSQRTKKSSTVSWLCELKNLTKFKQQKYHRQSQSSEEIYENENNLVDGVDKPIKNTNILFLDKDQSQNQNTGQNQDIDVDQNQNTDQNQDRDQKYYEYKSQSYKDNSCQAVPKDIIIKKKEYFLEDDQDFIQSSKDLDYQEEQQQDQTEEKKRFLAKNQSKFQKAVKIVQEKIVRKKNNKVSKQVEVGSIDQESFYVIQNYNNQSIQLTDKKQENVQRSSKYSLSSDEISQKKINKSNNKDDVILTSVRQTKKWLNQKNGLFYLQNLYKKKYNVKIVNYIGLTFLAQIIFFICINILFYQLIYDQTVKFKQKFNLLNLLDSGVGSYQKAFMNANYNYQINRNLMRRPTSKGLQYQLNIINQANNNLKYLIRYEQEFKQLVMNQVMNNYALILIDHNNNIRNYDLKKRQISIHQMLIQQINMYERYLIDPSYFDYERYYDLRINYQIMFIKFQQLLADTNQEINKNKVFFIDFYISTSAIGLLFGIIIMSLIIPLLIKFHIIQEKTLLLIARVNDNEGLFQSFFYQGALKMLQDKDDDYLRQSMNELEQSAQKSYDNYFKNNKKKENQASYLNSKIINQNISRNKFMNISLITIMSVFLFFVIYFVLLPEIQDKLDYTDNLKQQQSQLKSNLQNIKIFNQILFYLPYSDTKRYETQSTKKEYIKNYQSSLNNINQKVSKSSVQIFLSEMVDQKNLQLMNIILKQKDVCKMIKETVKCDITFEDGLVGYLSSVISEQLQFYPYIINEKALTLDQVYNLYTSEQVDQSLWKEYVSQKVLELLQNVVFDIVNIIFQDISDQFIILSIGGGVLCTFFLISILSYQHFKLKEDFSLIISSLCMIPNQKLLDEGMIQLLKKLDEEL